VASLINGAVAAGMTDHGGSQSEIRKPNTIQDRAPVRIASIGMLHMPVVDCAQIRRNVADPKHAFRGLNEAAQAACRSVAN
jgi:hypothetical protein